MTEENGEVGDATRGSERDRGTEAGPIHGGGASRGVTVEEGAESVPWALERLRSWVEIESPTGNVEGIGAAADHFRTLLESLEVTVSTRPAEGFGVHLKGDLPGGPGTSGEPPLLLLGHLDTVHPIGTRGRFPPWEEGDRISGPGVFDMKGGWICVAAALRLLSRRGTPPRGPIRWIITSDEEVGSPTSRAWIEEEARNARGCLVLEPSLPGGRAKVGRSGFGGLELRVVGREAHAGIEPEAGASATLALAELVVATAGLAAPSRGTFVNVGVMQGGTVPNVVAGEASATIDFRFRETAEGHRVVEGVRGLRPSDPRCRVEVSGGLNRGALENSEGNRRLFEIARREAAELGFLLEGGTTGGASDGNLTSAVGCPTLDGLGPEGGGAHTFEEHLLRSALPVRIALLARLLLVL